MANLQPCDVIFCGNPGVGKSSIASGVSGKQFKSGVSFGGGLTSELTFETSPSLPGIRFADTPGLSDMKLREAAATAITQALKEAVVKQRNVRLIFVITTEAGRMRTSDAYTIREVMGSITMVGGGPAPPSSYGVIVNKCAELELPEFHETGKEQIEVMLADAKTMRCPTSFVKWLPFVDVLKNAKNEKVAFPGLFEWIFTRAPCIQIAQADQISVVDMDQRIEELQKVHEEKMAELQALSSQQMQELREAQQAQREAAAQHEKQVELLQAKVGAAGGGLMGAFVDFTTLISKPIAKAFVPTEDFDLAWNRGLAAVKKFCIV